VRRLVAIALISGESASVDASSLDMEGRELPLLAFVLSTPHLYVVAASPRLTKFPAAEPLAAGHTDRSGRLHPPKKGSSEVGQNDDGEGATARDASDASADTSPDP
jgi:hypothetical protein